MPRVARLLMFSLVVAFLLACVAALRGDLAQLSLAPLRHSWDLVVLAAVLSLGNYAFRVVRWRAYLIRLGHWLPAGFTALTYLSGFAFTLSPGKMGEMARARYYAEAGIPVADIAGAFFVERLMDCVAMVVLAAAILTAVPHYSVIIWVTLAAVGSVLFMLAVYPWSALHRRLDQPAQPGMRAPTGVGRFLRAVVRALSASRNLLRLEVLISGLCLSLIAWGLEGIGLFVIGGLFQTVQLDIPVAVGIYAVAVMAGAVSFLPGGLGTTEAVMTALLVAQGYQLPEAILITVACRLVTLWLAVGIGWVSVLILRQRNLTAALPW
ncbi:MAG TPA: lysylphosphatidylglycerol synthase transmembrane domain-containing protein [Steroidobacteraceae bacterium]|nr:lysylphosphatidylglycerol synthase transmembrane domain-containing protein [Steroidobacteraceae bacterium]